jgi:16S rRNA (cytosine967-C5)-methyltransferase
MRQGARYQAAIILLEQILTSRTPADNIVTQYFRKSRYVGSSDRRVISNLVYEILRRHDELSWYLQSIPPQKAALARLLTLAFAFKIQQLTIQNIQELCKKNDGESNFFMDPLTPMEHLLLKDMERLKFEDMPPSAQLNVTPWILKRIESTFGPQTEDTIRALNQPAPFDLRVNTLKATRQIVLEQLSGEGLEVTPTPWSPVGLRLSDRQPLTGHELWKNGALEIQDEGSQLLALLTEAKPGMTVMDYCAGAGGKTLAMAATMENKGRIVASDIATWRLTRSKERLRRAGAHNVEFRSLDDGSTTKWLKRQAGRFDRVLIDAPCSGSGTWRRNPDMKRRLEEKDLEELVAKQEQILNQAHGLVKVGGRLIYATCSLFAEENDDQIRKFLAHQPNFKLLPISQVWHSVLGTQCPVTTDTLQLTPHLHNVDGFFVAVMERTS